MLQPQEVSSCTVVTVLTFEFAFNDVLFMVLTDIVLAEREVWTPSTSVSQSPSAVFQIIQHSLEGLWCEFIFNLLYLLLGAAGH